MELPITRPAQVSYGDELDFDKFLEKLARKRYNGFIRVTHASSEGHILLKEGIPIAASYDRYMKTEAMEKILEIIDKINTLIELFEVKESHMDYLIEINKVYKLEPTKEKVKPPTEIKTKEETKPPTEIKTKEKVKPPTEIKTKEKVKPPTEIKTKEETKPPTEIKTKEETKPPTEIKTKEETKPPTEIKTKEETKPPTEIKTKEETKPPTEIKTKEETKVIDELEVVETAGAKEASEIAAEREEIKVLNREEVMKKYGLKDIDEEEVEKVLETYKGGAITTIDIERVELTLMNKIKQSIMGIPNIKSVEVMIFLENMPELGGDIKVLIERESKGLLSRLISGVMNEEELKEHTYDIIEMEIKKTFRGYPEIIENFNINIEIH